MPTKTRKKRRPPRVPMTRTPEVLDVHMAAELLTVSRDTVYELFQSGELPGRKVGRKWITTKAAVLRWIESAATGDTFTRRIEAGDREALAEALNKGTARLRQ
jgi:excisionase family DNA binding protein